MAVPRRRRGSRVRSEHPAFFESSGQCGTATMTEFSYSGARLHSESPAPLVGELLRILVWPQRHAEPFEIAGRVVGMREQGFAVEYVNPGQALCQWIDALRLEAECPAPAERPGAAG